ncbi:MAG TPA: QueT transporter family protein [Candidatus Eubacterium faecipullorum]|uniref:QueT transporter family protein n=1 Tax=Candidatus Eubacterium faecipullorum TaxID=2838571 RepID=A0A9D1UFH4_9FIRM|nr:QueT transporter family protein [Candidatus Eubacterium faecipullorum]
MKNKKLMFIVQAAVIAAMYAALTYAQNFLLPGTTSAAVQFRVSEALNVFALFTPAAIPGLTIGCVLSNIYNIGSGLPLDMIFGSLATLLATLAMYLLRNVKLKAYPFLSMLMPAVFNGVIVGWEIETFFVEGDFIFADFLVQGGLVALGELGVMLVLGTVLYFLFVKRGLDKKLFSPAAKLSA